jgi:signal transduction histidine kinase
MDLFDKLDKIRQDMDAEVKTSFKWVVLAAVFGLVVVLMFYVMVVMAQADPGDIAIRSNTVMTSATNLVASVSLTENLRPAD